MGVKYRLGSSSRCVATFGVSILIVRNLGILKIVLLMPTRSDQNKTLPLEVSFTRSATSKMIGSRATSASKAEHMSKTRFDVGNVRLDPCTRKVFIRSIKNALKLACCPRLGVSLQVCRIPPGSSYRISYYQRRYAIVMPIQSSRLEQHSRKIIHFRSDQS